MVTRSIYSGRLDKDGKVDKKAAWIRLCGDVVLETDGVCFGLGQSWTSLREIFQVKYVLCEDLPNLCPHDYQCEMTKYFWVGVLNSHYREANLVARRCGSSRVNCGVTCTSNREISQTYER